VMGDKGMADMGSMEMPLPDNTLPMMTGQGPMGPLEMGGMFTTLKVREGLAADDYRDPGWFSHPAGTVAREWTGEQAPAPVPLRQAPTLAPKHGAGDTPPLKARKPGAGGGHHGH